MVDDSDYEFLNQWKWYAKKGKRTYYAKRSVTINGVSKCIAMHRIILGLTDPKLSVDHKDGDGLNNQRFNIRICNNFQNAANSRGMIGRTSKYKGVHWSIDRRKWVAQITNNGEKKCLGRYETQEEAAIAYNKAAIELQGEFAHLNKIEKVA